MGDKKIFFIVFHKLHKEMTLPQTYRAGEFPHGKIRKVT